MNLDVFQNDPVPTFAPKNQWRSFRDVIGGFPGIPVLPLSWLKTFITDTVIASTTLRLFLLLSGACER